MTPARATRAARATARVARTIYGDVSHRQVGIVRATLAVALAALEVKLSSWQSFTDPGVAVEISLTYEGCTDIV